MTSPITGFEPARDNEDEHRTLEDLAGEFNDCLEKGRQVPYQFYVVVYPTINFPIFP